MTKYSALFAAAAFVIGAPAAAFAQSVSPHQHGQPVAPPPASALPHQPGAVSPPASHSQAADCRCCEMMMARMMEMMQAMHGRDGSHDMGMMHGPGARQPGAIQDSEPQPPATTPDHSAEHDQHQEPDPE